MAGEVDEAVKEIEELLAKASLPPWAARCAPYGKLPDGWPVGYVVVEDEKPKVGDLKLGDGDEGNWWVTILGRHASEGPTHDAGVDAKLVAKLRNNIALILAERRVLRAERDLYLRQWAQVVDASGIEPRAEDADGSIMTLALCDALERVR
jgi:hypothetical protein